MFKKKTKKFLMKMKQLNKSYNYRSGGVKSAFSFVAIWFLSFVFIAIFSCSSEDKRQNPEVSFVITSPEVYELVCALGGGDLIVGRTKECTYPDLAEKSDIIGSFSNINIESVLKLNPDYVITSSLEQDKLSSDLNKLSIKTKSYYPKSVEELYTVIYELGNLTGLTAKADSLSNYLKENLSHKELNIKPRVYVEIYGNPVMSASNESFLGELVSVAGGENIFKTLPRDYSMINTEDVIKANPDIIILTYKTDKNIVLNRKGWQGVSAIKNKRVYTVDDIDPDLILRAGPRIVEGVRIMSEIFREFKTDEK